MKKKTSETRYSLHNLATALIKNGEAYQYRYDGSGKRIEKVQPNGSVLSYRRGAEGELLATYKNNGEVEKFFVGEEGEGIVSGGNEVNWRYYIRDVVGNVVGVVDRQGNVVGRSRYDAWGYEDTPRGNDGSQFERKFVGNSVDEESRLYDMGARPYEARLGRFVNPEPLYHDLTGISPYSYGYNNPIMYSDKNGEWANFVLGAAVGFVGEIASQMLEAKIKGESVNINWSQVGIATGAGLATGGLSSINVATRAARLAVAAAEVGVVVAESVGKQKVEGDATVSATKIGVDLISGGIGKYVGSKAGDVTAAATESAASSAVKPNIKRLVSGQVVSGVNEKEIAKAASEAGKNARNQASTVLGEVTKTPVSSATTAGADKFGLTKKEKESP